MAPQDAPTSGQPRPGLAQAGHHGHAGPRSGLPAAWHNAEDAGPLRLPPPVLLLFRVQL